MGNEYSKQVKNSPSSPYRARGCFPSDGSACPGCQPKERHCLSKKCAKGTISWKGREIVQQSSAKGPMHIAYLDSESHGQRPFINYSKAGNDGLRITAAFSLNYSNHYSRPESIRKDPPVQNSEELNFSIMQQNVVSELLPGGFTTAEKNARWKYDLPTKSDYRLETEPRVSLQDRKNAAYNNNFKLPNAYCREVAYSNNSEFFVQSGSNNPTPTSISKTNCSAIWSVTKPTDNWKPVTDLLWSYQAHGRLQGDTTIPTFPILSYGDRLPFNEATITSKRTCVRPLQPDNIKSLKIPKHSKSIPGQGNVYNERSDERGDERIDAYKGPECMQRTEVERRPLHYTSFEQSHRLRASRDGQSHPLNSSYTRASLLSHAIEGNIWTDMSCREMPASLGIGYPKDGATMRQGVTNDRSTSVKQGSQAHNGSFSFPGLPNEQPRRAKEIIYGPLPNIPEEQLSRTSPFSKVSVRKSSRVAEMEPSRTRRSPQVHNFASGRLHNQNVPRDHFWEAKDPQGKISTAVMRGTETQTFGDEMQRKSFQKSDNLPESAAGRFRTSQSHANHVKIPLATVLSQAGSEDSRSCKRGKKTINRCTTIGASWITLGATDSSILSAEEPGLDKVKIEREQILSSHSTSTRAVSSSSGHSDGMIQKQKQRYNCDSFTLSLQKKVMMESLSNETRAPTSNERQFMAEEISPEKVGPNTSLAESSHASTFEAEGTDSSSSADSHYGAVVSSNSLASSEESDDEDSVTFIQEKTKEGLQEVGKATTNKPTCDICSKTFTRNNTLISHKRIHSGARPYSCEKCGRAFRQQGNLTRHMLTHTSIKDHTCSYCNKKFSSASNLHIHLRIHTNYRPFKCDICEKSFYQKMDLKVHRYTHTGEKPHVCPKCGKGFKQVTHLKYHLRIHSDVRMFTCEYCGKGFNQKGNLQAHIYAHTGDRPHKCEICGKAFTLASTLNTHKRTHAATKPFQCKFCSKAYYQKNALKTHYISTHPFTSGYCNV